MNRRPLRVVVVGGGIGGLTSNVLLAQAEVKIDQTLEISVRRIETRVLHGSGGQVLTSLRMPNFRPGLDHGLCNSALVDAAVLALELHRPGTAPSDALRRYEQPRRPAVLRVQRTRDRLAWLASLRGRARTSLRDQIMWALSRPTVLSREIRAAQQEDPTRLLDQLLKAKPSAYQKGQVSWK